MPGNPNIIASTISNRIQGGTCNGWLNLPRLSCIFAVNDPALFARYPTAAEKEEALDYLKELERSNNG